MLLILPKHDLPSGLISSRADLLEVDEGGREGCADIMRRVMSIRGRC